MTKIKNEKYYNLDEITLTQTTELVTTQTKDPTTQKNPTGQFFPLSNQASPQLWCMLATPRNILQQDEAWATTKNVPFITLCLHRSPLHNDTAVN